MKGERTALFFFIDALGWELATREGVFRDLAPHVYRQRTVLGYSCAAQPTILTGTMPCAHGHWAMFYRTERSELADLARLAFLPDWLSQHPRFRRRLLALHRRRSGFTGYYNLYNIPLGLFRRFDLSEKRDIYAPGAFGGRVESVFDALSRSGVPYRVWNWRYGLDQSFAELRHALTGTEPLRFALLYTAHLDALLHQSIGDERAAREALLDIERRISEAAACARERHGHVDIVIFSDHGMTKTTGARDLMSFVRSLGPREGRDFVAFYDSTMARFWLLDEGARNDLVAGLESLDSGAVVGDDALRREGVFFEDGRYGDLVFLMHPGLLVMPSFMGKESARGMHGFSPDHEDSHAVLMSSRPIAPEPSHIADTFRVMLDLARSD